MWCVRLRDSFGCSVFFFCDLFTICDFTRFCFHGCQVSSCRFFYEKAMEKGTRSRFPVTPLPGSLISCEKKSTFMRLLLKLVTCPRRMLLGAVFLLLLASFVDKADSSSDPVSPGGRPILSDAAGGSVNTDETSEESLPPPPGAKTARSIVGDGDNAVSLGSPVSGIDKETPAVSGGRSGQVYSKPQKRATECRNTCTYQVGAGTLYSFISSSFLLLFCCLVFIGVVHYLCGFVFLTYFDLFAGALKGLGIQ